MMKRSWFYQNGIFFTILAFILLIHMILLALRFSRQFEISQVPPEEALKVRILNERESKNQIADSEAPETQITKDDAYLSDKTRAVDRQSKARTVDSFKQGGQGLGLGDLGAFPKGHDPLKDAAKEYAKTGGSKGRGVSSTNDHLLKVPEGDLTYLNTVEYKYYGFYHRIKLKLEQFWGRSIQEKAELMVSSGRRLASDEDLITALVVVMNDVGEIISISVKGSSGVKELDDAAVDSFNEAGPFPNPPKGLIVGGKVKIEWGFVVNT